ncbi:MAG: ATP-dependent Clp protease adaptor ClpS [Bacteroidia bacterium]
MKNWFKTYQNNFGGNPKEKEQEDVLILEDEDQESKVVLYNDDVNSFDWVIECLVEICEHDYLQAEQCALLVHLKGKAIVKSGSQEKMKSICQALCDRDLSAIIE